MTPIAKKALTVTPTAIPNEAGLDASLGAASRPPPPAAGRGSRQRATPPAIGRAQRAGSRAPWRSAGPPHTAPWTADPACGNCAAHRRAAGHGAWSAVLRGRAPGVALPPQERWPSSALSGCPGWRGSAGDAIASGWMVTCSRCRVHQDARGSDTVSSRRRPLPPPPAACLGGCSPCRSAGPWWPYSPGPGRREGSAGDGAARPGTAAPFHRAAATGGRESPRIRGRAATGRARVGRRRHRASHPGQAQGTGSGPAPGAKAIAQRARVAAGDRKRR